MNAKDILDYVDNQPSTTREVFSTISESPSSKEAAIAILKDSTKKFNKTILEWDAYIKSESIENFMAYAEEWSMNDRKTLKHRLIIAPFKKQWIKVFASMFKLNPTVMTAFANEENEKYYQIGDGAMLAGLYLFLSN